MTGVHHPGEALTTMAGEGIRGKHQREQKRRQIIGDKERRQAYRSVCGCV